MATTTPAAPVPLTAPVVRPAESDQEMRPVEDEAPPPLDLVASDSKPAFADKSAALAPEVVRLLAPSRLAC